MIYCNNKFKTIFIIYQEHYNASEAKYYDTKNMMSINRENFYEKSLKIEKREFWIKN